MKTNQTDLYQANQDLGQPKKKPIWFWILIIAAIVVGSIIVVGGLFVLYFVAVNGGSTYPFIPTPRNTLRSTNRYDMLMNIIMDANETADKYGVVSRTAIR